MQPKISFTKWLLKRPLVRLLPILAVPLYRFTQSKFILDAIFSAIVLIGVTYLWYRLATSPKGAEFMNEVNKNGGWVALILIGVSIVTNPLLAVLLGGIWLIYVYRKIQQKPLEDQKDTV